MSNIPLAIVGCGGMGHRHLFGLAELHRAGLLTVVRPPPPAELVLRIDAAGDIYHQGALVPLPELPAWLRQKTGLAEGRIAAELPREELPAALSRPDVRAAILAAARE